MRKFIKGAGAATLAAATVVTGLSFGPGAAMAAPAETPTAKVSTKALPEVGSTFKWVTEADNGTYWGGVKPEALKQYDTRKAAEDASPVLTVLAGTMNDTFRVGISGTSYCFSWATMNRQSFMTSGACVGTNNADLKLDAAGLLTDQSGTRIVLAAQRVATGYFGYPVIAAPEPGTPVESAQFEGLNSLGATVDSVDLINRTAKISGFGKPNSYVIIDADQQVPVDSDGKWNAEITGLDYGDNTVHLENWVDGSRAAQKDLTVTLKVADLTGVASSTTSLTDDITISGDGQKGADITIKNEKGETVATTTVNATTGRYNALVAAPNAAGVHTFTVSQSIKGIPAGAKAVEFNYGAGVDVTSPANDVAHPGGTIDFSGTGQPNAEVQLREEGQSGVLGTATVLANSTWSIKGVDLSASEHKLVVTQTSTGNNVTTDTVTLNPGSVGVTKPLAITTPTEGSTVIDKDGKVTFTGTGKTGQTVKLQGANGGRVLGTTTVDDKGNWTYTTWLSESHFLIDATMGTETKTVSFTVQKNAGVTQPLSITTPTEGSTVSNSTGTVVFTGKGTTGQTVKLQGANGGRVLGTTTVKSDGSWTYTTWLTQAPFMIDATSGAETKTVNFTVDKGEAVTNPFTVTSPASGSTAGVAGRLDWSGTGKAGETISIVNQYGVTKTTTKVLSNGTWAVTTFDMIANTYDYTLTESGTNESARVTGIVVNQ